MTSDVDRAAVEIRLLTAAFWAEKTLNAELRAQLERARDLAARSLAFYEVSPPVTVERCGDCGVITDGDEHPVCVR